MQRGALLTVIGTVCACSSPPARHDPTPRPPADAQRRALDAAVPPDATPEKTVRFPDGTIEERGERGSGAWTRYYPGGAVELAEVDGTITQYARDGRVLGTYTMKDGTGVETLAWDDGTPRREVHWKDGVRDGASREWDAQGHLVIDETWAAGVLDGDRTIGTPKGIGRVVEHWTKGVRTGDRKISWKGHPRLVEHYDDDGKLDGAYTVYRGSSGGLRIEGRFAHGVRTGTWTWYASDGKPERQGKYRNGLQDGAWTKWNGDIVTATGRFKHGLPDGTFVLYDDQGTEVGRYTMKRGTGTMLDFHRKDRKARATEYVDGVRQGADTAYSPKGAVIEQGQWDADVRDGDWRTVDADGSVVTAHWDHGVLDGAWRRTRADGSVALAVSYVHGLRDGDVTETFPDGTPMLEGHFAADLRDGEWVTHAPDGTVALRATYAAGELLDSRAP